MPTTYDVRIWNIEVRERKRGTTYRVRWFVDGKSFEETFTTAALADSYRSNLVTASRKGEAFDVESGLPMSMARTTRDMNWYLFVCKFVDMKWPRVAATTRRTHAEAFTALTPGMFSNRRGKPSDKLIRKALSRWGFNTAQRGAKDCPADVRAALRWVERNTLPVSALAKPDVLRPMLDSLTFRLDGKPSASSVVSRRRKVLNTAIEYAVELGYLDANPMPALKWKAPKSILVVDPRGVPNPIQVRTLLEGVREQGRVGRRLVAYYGCLYYAGMRPEEAAHLNKRHLAIPRKGWGEFHLDGADPYAGKEWTDTGRSRDRRQLKQRDRGESRTVPCPPELTALIHEHLDEFGTTSDGRLFVGDRNKEELPRYTVNRIWRQAREIAFTADVVASALAKRPYDLRHAAVSTWLNGGVPPTDVAEWAGQSVEVLFRIYAKCLDRGVERNRRRVQAALGHK